MSDDFGITKRPSTIADLNPKPFLNYFLNYSMKWFSAKEVVSSAEWNAALSIGKEVLLKEKLWPY